LATGRGKIGQRSAVVAGTPRAVAGDTLIAGDDRRDLE